MTCSIGRLRAEHSEYYEKECYYLRGQSQGAYWFGNGARLLGFGDQVRAKELRALLQGRSPAGTPLVQNPDSPKRQAGWDLTFSPDKTVSAIWAIAGRELREQIHQCERRAVDSVLSYAEKQLLFTRRGGQGKQVERCAPVIAVISHASSREGDFQLHKHCLVMNVGVRSDGTTGTILSHPLYEHKMLLGALYRAELAAQLRRGLGIRVTAGKYGIRIDGVPSSLVDEASTARRNILAKMKALGLHSAAAAARVTLAIRKSKQEIHKSELDRRWRDLALRHGFHEQSVNRLLNQALEVDIHAAKEQSWQKALETLTSSYSHFSEADLTRRVAEHAAGYGLGLDEMLSLVQTKLHEEQSLVFLGYDEQIARYTTPEMIQREKELYAHVATLYSSTSHAVSLETSDWVKAGVDLNDEQAYAFKEIVESSTGLGLLSGFAGTGKTRLLDACRQAWEREGYEVLGASFTGKAARGLEEGASIRSFTIEKLFHTLEEARQDKPCGYYDNPHPPKAEEVRLNKSTVLVVDEASMVGTDQMARLLDEASQAQAKVVLLGDQRQLQAIQAGSPFASLVSTYGGAELSEIVRQRDAWTREAVKLFAIGEADKALGMYQERGLVHVADDRQQAMEKLVADWTPQGRDAPRENLIFVQTNREAEIVNKMCQAARVDENHAISAEVPKGELLTGDRVLFTRNSKQLGVSNGDLGTIEKIDETGTVLAVTLDRGPDVVVPLKTYSDVQLGYAITTHKGQGVTVKNAFVLAGGANQSRELSYVQASRAQEVTQFYTDRCEAGDNLEHLKQQMSRSEAKSMAHDIIRNQPADVERPTVEPPLTFHERDVEQNCTNNQDGAAAVPPRNLRIEPDREPHIQVGTRVDPAGRSLTAAKNPGEFEAQQVNTNDESEEPSRHHAGRLREKVSHADEERNQASEALARAMELLEQLRQSRKAVQDIPRQSETQT